MESTTPRTRAGRPKQNRIDRRVVVREAMALADADGVEGVTMRKLATRLGVEAASLYYHFANRDEILRMVGRAAVSDIPVPVRVEDADWREWLLRIGLAYRRVLLDRPYLATLVASGLLPWEGLPVYHTARELFADDGIPEEWHDRLLHVQQLFVVGAAMLQHSQGDGPEDEAGESADERERQVAADFELGLRVLLDGLVQTFQLS